jgi:hypothetical protein
MKKLELDKEVAVELPSGQVEKFKHRDHLVSVLSMPSDPSKGINYEEMGTRCDLIKKIKETEADFVFIETAEHKSLCDALKAHKYPIVSTAIHEFIKSIISLPDVEVKEA